MDWSLSFFAIAGFAVLFAAVSKGGFGSGVSFAAAPMLALILEPAQALGLLLPTLLVMDAASLRPYWGRWDWVAARLLILGAMPVVALGIALGGFADAGLLRVFIGVVALAFVAFEAARALGYIRAADAPLPKSAGLFAGALAGFTSFVSHAGGPIAAVYLLSERMEKTTYQATTVVVFGAINVVKMPAYASLGMIPAETLGVALIVSPVAVLGVWLGVWLHKRLSGRAFFVLTYVFLTFAGVKLIYDGLI